MATWLCCEYSCRSFCNKKFPVLTVLHCSTHYTLYMEITIATLHLYMEITHLKTSPILYCLISHLPFMFILFLRHYSIVYFLLPSESMELCYQPLLLGKAPALTHLLWVSSICKRKYRYFLLLFTIHNRSFSLQNC